MDIEGLIAFIATWVAIKSVVFLDHYDFIPLIVSAYLLFCLKRAIDQENLESTRAEKTNQNLKVDGFCQTTLVEYQDKAVQVKQITSDAATQVTVKKVHDKETQTEKMTGDATSEMDVYDMSATGMQTMEVVMNDKDNEIISKDLKPHVSQTSDSSEQRDTLPPELEIVKSLEMEDKTEKLPSGNVTSDDLCGKDLHSKKGDETKLLKKKKNSGFMKKFKKVRKLFKPKKSQTSVHLVEEIKVQTEVMLFPTKESMPKDTMIPEATIPPSEEFLAYHRWNHERYREDFKFYPTLETILEVEEEIEEPELCHFPSEDDLKIHKVVAGDNVTEENYSVNLSLESDAFKRKEPHTKEEYGIKWKGIKISQRPLLDEIGLEHGNDSERSDSPPPVLEPEKSLEVEDDRETQNCENITLDDLYCNDLHTEEGNEYKPLRQKKNSFVKKKFKNLKNFFKK